MTFWIVAGIVTLLAAWTGFQTRRSDFQMLWTSAHLWWTGADPYSGAVAGADLNPPFVIWLLTPLGWLSAPVAFGLWTLLGWACVAVAASRIAEACQSSSNSRLTIMAVALVTVGGTTATASGQLTWPLLLLVTLGWLADRRGFARATGVSIGLMFAVKLFFGLWLVDLVLRRAGRTLAFATAVALLAFAVGLTVNGVIGYTSWLEALGRITWTGKEMNASMLGLWARVLPSARVRSIWAVSAIGIAVAGVAAACRERDVDIRWSVLILTALLVSPLGWVYYVPLALGPLWALHVRGSFRVIDGLLLVAWCIPFGLPDPQAATGKWWPLVWANRYTCALFALWLRVLGQHYVRRTRPL